MECGVIQYRNRNCASLSSREPSVALRRYRLKVWTALSARPLVAGWYGAEVLCLMPLDWAKA